LRYLHLYTGGDGDTHFEDAELEFSERDYRPPAPLLFVSHAFDANGLQFVKLPGGWTGEAIQVPKAQFLICLTGHVEITASDGDKRSLGPGEAVLMADVGGKGHRTHVRAGHDCTVAVIPFG